MYKRLIVLVILILSVMPLISVNAQTASEGIDYCEIMQTDDCQLLLSSAEAMSGVGSFAFDMSLAYDIAIEGGKLGINDLSFGLDGSGILAIDVDYFNELNDLSISDPTAYLKQFPAMMDGVYSKIEGEAYFVLTLPDMFGAMIGETELPLNLLMKDGVYVVDVASLADAVGEDANGMEWAGVDLNGMFESMLGDFDLSSFYDADMLESIMQFGDTEFLKEVVSVTRLADSNINGESVAVFEVVFDYGAFLATDNMTEMAESMYQNMGMDQQMIDSTLSTLEGVTVIFHEYIGLNDSYTYRVEMNMDFVMDGAMMGDPTMDSMTLGFDMSIDLSDFNTPVDIQIPEDAMIMPASMLMGSGF